MSADQLLGLVSVPRVLLLPTASFSFNMDRDRDTKDGARATRKANVRDQRSHLTLGHHVGFDWKPLPPGAVPFIGLRTLGDPRLHTKPQIASVC